jgi:hypothetical protein
MINDVQNLLKIIMYVHILYLQTFWYLPPPTQLSLVEYIRV